MLLASSETGDDRSPAVARYRASTRRPGRARLRDGSGRTRLLVGMGEAQMMCAPGRSAVTYTLPSGDLLFSNNSALPQQSSAAMRPAASLGDWHTSTGGPGLGAYPALGLVTGDPTVATAS